MSVVRFVSVVGAPVSYITLIVNCIKQSGKSPPNQYCKVLRTAMYKRYINSKFIYLFILSFHFHEVFKYPNTFINTNFRLEKVTRFAIEDA